MEHIAAILLLVGCSGNLQHCEELPAPTAIYETDEDCRAALGPSLAIHSTHPRIFGACIYTDPALEQGDAELVWDVSDDGKLHATIEAAPLVVASNGTQADTTGQQ